MAVIERFEDASSCAPWCTDATVGRRRLGEFAGLVEPDTIRRMERP
jgi:hypothetical protein